MSVQISLFDDVQIIWRRYPGCTKGFCPLCGRIAWYGPFHTFGSFENGVPECECGAKFTEEKPPIDLPIRSGITDLPISTH